MERYQLLLRIRNAEGVKKKFGERIISGMIFNFTF